MARSSYITLTRWTDGTYQGEENLNRKLSENRKPASQFPTLFRLQAGGRKAASFSPLEQFVPAFSLRVRGILDLHPTVAVVLEDRGTPGRYSQFFDFQVEVKWTAVLLLRPIRWIRPKDLLAALT